MGKRTEKLINTPGISISIPRVLLGMSDGLMYSPVGQGIVGPSLCGGSWAFWGFSLRWAKDSMSTALPLQSLLEGAIKAAHAAGISGAWIERNGTCRETEESNMPSLQQVLPASGSNVVAVECDRIDPDTGMAWLTVSPVTRQLLRRGSQPIHEPVGDCPEGYPSIVVATDDDTAGEPSADTREAFELLGVDTRVSMNASAYLALQKLGACLYCIVPDIGFYAEADLSETDEDVVAAARKNALEQLMGPILIAASDAETIVGVIMPARL